MSKEPEGEVANGSVSWATQSYSPSKSEEVLEQAASSVRAWHQDNKHADPDDDGPGCFTAGPFELFETL